MVKVFEISSTYFHTSVVQDPKVGYTKKINFFSFFLLALELAVLEWFWVKNCHGTLGVKPEWV
jgi:hypothetical protein